MKIPRNAIKKMKINQKTLPIIGIKGPSPKYAKELVDLKIKMIKKINKFKLFILKMVFKIIYVN